MSSSRALAALRRVPGVGNARASLLLCLCTGYMQQSGKRQQEQFADTHLIQLGVAGHPHFAWAGFVHSIGHRNAIFVAVAAR